MIFKNKILTCFFFSFGVTAFAQQQPYSMYSAEEITQVKEVFTKGHFHSHIRNFFLSTYNQRDLKDYYTNATGGAIGFTTANFKGFEIGVKGSFTYKTFGTDLENKDPMTGKNSKWEYELYDVLNQGNFRNLDRLEELFLKYRYGNSYVSYGKIETEYTPLLNRSDGRMTPFAHRGGWTHLNITPHHQVNLGWLNGVSPRATTEWFSIEDGMGLFNNGHQPNGELAEYYEQYPSSGIGIANYNFQKNNFSFKVYDVFIDKLINTVWAEVGLDMNSFYLGMQYVYQTPLKFNEELQYINRYVQPSENGQVLSSQLGWQKDKLNFTFAYTHAFDSGRFLFPKELGRDHFFSSISRSRLEGLGNVDVFTLKGKYLPIRQIHLGVKLQQIKGADPNMLQFNKYSVDESFQVNSRIRYEAQGFFEGVSFDVLWVYRENLNHTEAQSIFNRSNFNQLNFVTNFQF